MTTSTQHIITRLNWDTTFNQRENSVMLQNRLSNWSNKIMVRELASLFDEICPPDQCWQLDFLQLNLGQISIDELEDTLSIRLLSQLRAQLRDMVLHEQATKLNITFTDETATDLELITVFLQQGVMSWNKRLAKGDINQLLALQFVHNRTALIERLKTLGKASLQVRKRMAWQFNEEHMVALIKGLEPNYHQEIFDFGAELEELQDKETLVKAESNEFHRNIWLWVLNFLLVDRGTTFNKVAFMLSSVNQMADHYNMDRRRLFELLGAAAHKITAQMAIRSDFMLILKEASNRYQHAAEKVEVASPNAAWEKLKSYLDNISICNTEKHRKQFNDLVIGLAGQNPETTKSILVQALRHKLKVVTLVAVLDEVAMASVYSLFGHHTAELLETIDFLTHLAPQIHTKANVQFLRQIGLEFLLATKQQAYNPSHFLSYCFKAMSKDFQVEETNLLARLLTAKLNSQVKTSTNLSLYHKVEELYQQRVLVAETGWTNSDFEMQLRYAMEQFKHEGQSDNFIEILQKYMRLNPAQALTTLTQTKDKTVLKGILPKLLTGSLLRALIQTANQKQIAVYTALMQGLALLKKSGRYGELSLALEEKLTYASLYHYLLYPTASHEQLLVRTMRFGYSQLSASYQKEFASFLKALLDTKAFDGVISTAKANQLIDKYAKSNQQSSMLAIKALLQQKTLQPALLAKTILDNDTDPQVAELGKSIQPLTHVILNIVLKDGTMLFTRFMAESKAWLDKTLKRSLSVKESQLLVLLFWKCALAYEKHQGNLSVFKKMLLTAFGYHFSGKANISPANQEWISRANSSTASISVKPNLAIPANEFFKLLETCLSKQQTTIRYEKETLALKLLLDCAIAFDSGKLLVSLSRFEPEQLAVLLLKASISWREFTMFLQYHATGNSAAVHEAMRLLFDWTEANATEAIGTNWMLKTWIVSLKIAETGRISSTAISELFNELMIALGQHGHSDLPALYTDFKKQGFLQNKILKEILHRYPSFKLLLEDRQKEDEKNLQGDEPTAEWVATLMEELLAQQQIPIWYVATTSLKPGELLDQLIATHPLKFLHCLKITELNEVKLLWLGQTLNFSKLANTIGRLNPNQQPLLHLLVQLHKVLGKIAFQGIQASLVQQVLLGKILKAWKNNNWKTIGTLQIWNELLWELKSKYNYSEKSFLTGLEQVKMNLPLALQLSLRPVFDRLKNNQTVARVQVPGLVQNKSAIKIEEAVQIGLEINNAGLVLLSGYVPMLFKYVNIQIPAKGDTELDPAEIANVKGRAVHYLQYLVTGSKSTDEIYLSLNKIFCGLPIAEPIPKEITIEPKEEELMEGLITSVIGHWEAIGSSSVDGFRGNWLMRKGLLYEKENKWELVVEKQPYDMLIQQLELSFSIIKFPWMEKPLHVNWPY
ncbi:contractile injection system tape measure protein [Pedobacter sp. KR3-3]|uniref:Contractile injection system tape measure protein n=1 Tax=Pedobacter albus TaxID=3113905 RepID=A0ABU7I4X0_9SPHI|nr:contractile injection system tape measure protein [Pedobacter sp. KR3-3]MEE1944503.1 contractile injection system tape measure protein [Pedobacter sp. KR3-3]